MKRKVVERKLTIDLWQGEYELFRKAFENSACRKQNDFARKLLTGKPVTVKYRNRSLDDFIEMGVGLRKDLRRLLSGETLSMAEKTEIRQRVITIEENLIKLVELCKHI